MAQQEQRLAISDESFSDDEQSQIRGLEEDNGIVHHKEVDFPPQNESDDDERINPRKMDLSERRPSTSKSVRFTGHQDTEENSEDERQEIIRKLENPHSPPTPHSQEETDDDDELLLGAPKLEYPPTSPPAYSPGTSPRRMNSPPPLKPNVMQRTSNVEEESEEDEIDEANFTEEQLAVLELVNNYMPEEIVVKPVFRPFLLDYFPAIGDIDAFIKIPRPDEVEDNIGFTELDEPSITQSDPTIVDMKMRTVAKEVTTQEDAPVKRLQEAEKNTEKIGEWITSIKELHRTRPSQTVMYKGPMPDVETLMQEWPSGFEQKLAGLKLPTADLDVSLEEYADICLALLDIPVGKSRIQSLHMLFSLYNEFKNSQHFRNLAQNNNMETFNETTDRLEL